MSRQPDYRIRVSDPETKQRGTAGAAWRNDDGSISIVLDPCVVLSGRDTKLRIRMFPADYPSSGRATDQSEQSEEYIRQRNERVKKSAPPSNESDEPPF